jgi:outer membrane biosynthesis protein TonB
VNGELESALAFRAKTAHKCYDDALAQDSSLKGTVKINVRVAANGNVCSANVASSDLTNPSVANCIASRFRQAGHFPAPNGGCLDVNIPISLMPPR